MQGLLGVGAWMRVLFVLAVLLVASRASAEDATPAVIVITAGDEATSGAAIRIDGEPSGTVPVRKTLGPGL